MPTTPEKMLHRIDHNLAAALQTKGIDRQRKTPLPQQQLDRQDVCPVSVVHRKSPAFHLLQCRYFWGISSSGSMPIASR